MQIKEMNGSKAFPFVFLSTRSKSLKKDETRKKTCFWAMMKNLFLWRFLHENGIKRNPMHAAVTQSSSQEVPLPSIFHMVKSQRAAGHRP